MNPAIDIESVDLLMPTEDKIITQLEEAVKAGLDTCFEVSFALKLLKEKEAYKSRGFKNFEEYCKATFQISRGYAYELIKQGEVAASVENDLSSVDDKVSGIALKALAKVPKEKRSEVFQKAASAGRVTAKSIRQAAEPSGNSGELEGKPRPDHGGPQPAGRNEPNPATHPAPTPPDHGKDFEHACGVGSSRFFFASHIENICARVINDASDDQLNATVSQLEVELKKLRKEQTDRRERALEAK